MKKIFIIFVLSLLLVGCNEKNKDIITNSNDTEKNSTVDLEIGSLGTQQKKYEITTDVSVYIENEKIIYENKDENVKVTDETILSPVLYIEGVIDCNNKLYLAALTDKGTLYYNINQDLNDYKLSFKQVDIDSTVYGLDVKSSKDDECMKDILFAYTDEKVLRKIEEKKEFNDNGIEEITGITLGKTYDEL